MLNKDNLRELAYVVRVDAIEPITGSDNCEAAVVGGWKIMVRKGTFKAGDLGIYFEIDSKLDETNEAFSFMEKKHYSVKTQKYTFGGAGCFFSQGLLMKPGDLQFAEGPNYLLKENKYYEVDKETRFLTKELKVTYYIPEDNHRKSGKVDPEAKYKAMAARHPKVFTKPFVKWLYKHKLGKMILFVFFGKKTKSTSFPKHFAYIKPTDEERVENMPWVLEDKRHLIATEKLDGTSTTFILERKRKKFEFYVLSRHVRQLKEDQECFHDYNIYWAMAKKYDVEEHLKDYLLTHPELDYICIQGESVGKVQGNPLKLEEDDFYAFNFIRSDSGRISSIYGKELLEKWGMKWVPILDTEWVNPDTMEEMKELATGPSALNPRVLREGLVYRDPLNNVYSFKNVSREFLANKKE